MSVYERMLERYESGQLPWHDALPPPEVMETVASLPVGRALDLGCGPGRASIYLAALGWQVDGVDFIPKAIEMARAAAEEAGVSPTFHLASVSKLDFLSGLYDFAVDVGCCHTLDDDALRTYHNQLKRLLRPAGRYLLFARLKDDGAAEDGPSSLEEALLREIFQEGFALDQMTYGHTQAGQNPAWRSAWFWFRRTG